MADLGTGVAATYNSSFFADALSISWGGISREPIETTNLGTTVARTFVPGDLYDPGELSVEMQLAPAVSPPIITGAAAETVTLTYTDSGAATWACSGFMTSFEVGVPLEERVTGTATIKYSGAVTITP